MVKRILIVTALCLFAGILFGGYFYHVRSFISSERNSRMCSAVSLNVLDSLESSIIDRDRLLEAAADMVLDRQCDSIDIFALEKSLKAMGGIRTAEVYTVRGGEKVMVEITQRKPVIRFQNGSERHYADSDGYLFPVSNASDVQIVTGNLPIGLPDGYKGFSKEQASWISSMINLAGFIDSSPYWKKTIEQIEIDSNGDVVLYTAVDSRRIVFGQPSDISTKFRKLEAFYRNILPDAGEKSYTTVNLKYRNQIICK